MNQTYLILAGVGGFVVLLVLLVVMVSRFAKRKTAEWVQGASAIGLVPSGRYPLFALTGTLDGAPVGLRHVQTKRRSMAGKHSHTNTTTWCYAQANIAGGTGDLHVAEEGMFAKLGTMLGGQDHKTGDEAFDKRFLVKGSAEHVPRLTPNGRAALLLLESKLRGEVSIEQGAVHWKGGSVNDAAKAQDLLRALAATANAFRD